MKPYRYVNAGTIESPVFEIIWSGNIGKPVATCADARDAIKICVALNYVDAPICVVPEATMSLSSGLQWIAVEDHLPDDDINFLVWDGEYLSIACHDGNAWVTDGGCRIPDDQITHWADPEPPKS